MTEKFTTRDKLAKKLYSGLVGPHWNPDLYKDIYSSNQIFRAISQKPIESSPHEIYNNIYNTFTGDVVYMDGLPGSGKGYLIRQIAKLYEKNAELSITEVAADSHLYVNHDFGENFAKRNEITIQNPEIFRKSYIHLDDVRTRINTVVKERNAGKENSEYRSCAYVRHEDGTRSIENDYLHADKIGDKDVPIFVDGTTTTEIQRQKTGLSVFKVIDPLIGFWNLMERDIIKGHGKTPEDLIKRLPFRLMEYLYLEPRMLNILLYKPGYVLYDEEFENNIYANAKQYGEGVEKALQKVDVKDIELDISKDKPYKEADMRDSVDRLRDKILEAVIA